jgi:hypothetical protein
VYQLSSFATSHSFDVRDAPVDNGDLLQIPTAQLIGKSPQTLGMPARAEEWTSLLRMTISKWPARSTDTSAGGATLQTWTIWFLGRALYYLHFSISSSGTTIQETDRVWTGLICASSTLPFSQRGLFLPDMDLIHANRSFDENIRELEDLQRTASSDLYCSALWPALKIAYSSQLDGVTSSPKRSQRQSTDIQSTTLYRFASSSCNVNQADSYRRRERGVLTFKDEGDSLRYLVLSHF